MHELSFSSARTTEDVEEAFRLALSIFSENSALANYPDLKTALWREDPSFEPGNLLLARDDSRRLVGMVRIVPRSLYRVDQKFTVAGVSSVCIDPEFRGKGFSSRLMKYALEQSCARGFDLALLFARRAADHYYTRFGFWGLSSYNRVTFQLEPGGGTPTQPVTLAVPRAADADAFAVAHADCYAGCFGRFERAPAYWRFLARKLAGITGTQWLAIMIGGVTVGYVIASGEVVHEIACTAGVAAGDVMRALPGALRISGNAPLVFEIPPQHRLVRDMAHTDMTVSFRECSYGGHMVRILDVSAVADAYARRAADHYRAMGAGRMETMVDGIRIARDGESSHATVVADGPSLSYAQTCRLLGSHTLSTAPDGHDRILPFNVSFPDQL